MAWPIPPAANIDIQDPAFLKQFWLAARERYLVATYGSWPRHGYTYASGTVPAGVTVTTFTDPDAGTPPGSGWCTGTGTLNPFACGVPDSMPDAATDFDVVFDHADPELVVRARITSWTATTLTYETIVDAVTSGQIPSAASLAGRRYYITRRLSHASGRGLWWSDRVLEWGNDYEYARGLVVAGAAGSLTANVQAGGDLHRDPAENVPPTWAVNEHAGREVLFYATDGLLKRRTVTANTADVLTFSGTAAVPNVGAAYCVVAPGARAYPGRPHVHPFTWYRGYMEHFWSRRPTGEAEGTRLPVTTVATPVSAGGGLCTTIADPVWDFDLYTGVTADGTLGEADFSDCGRPSDKFYGPDLWKTLRGLQVALEDVSVYFVEPKPYTGLRGIPRLVPATAFKLAGINHYTTTSTDVPGDQGGTLEVGAVGAPYFPVDVHWALIDGRGYAYKYGTGILSNATTLIARADPSGDPVFSTFVPGGPPEDDEGKTVVISLGWTRYAPRQFRRMFPKSCFVPDVITDPGPPETKTIKDPPSVHDYATLTCAGVGGWVKRPASTTYIDYDNATSASPSADGFGKDRSDRPFSAGDLARYVGDNWNDPTIDASGGGSPIGTADATDAALLVNYYDRFFVGRHAPDVQVGIDAQTRGTATGGTTTTLTDTAQNWFDFWSGDGVLRTEAGTATGGSETSLIDTAKTTEPARCWWNDGRFDGFGGSFVGFVVEVQAVDEVWHKRAIATGNSTGATLTWAEPLPFSAAGRPYRIREPRYEVNRYEGRRLVIHPPEGDSQTVTITANDDTTLCFTPALPAAVVAGSTYRIEDPPTGGVWKRVGSAWVAPVGADAVRTGVSVPADFHRRQTENLPTYDKRFWRYLKGDAVGLSVFDELYRFANVLRWTRATGSWDCKPGETQPNERNSRATNPSFGNPACSDPYQDAIDHAKGTWGTYDAVDNSTGSPPPDGIPDYDNFECGSVPFARAGGLNAEGCVVNTSHSYSLFRRYAYPKVFVPSTGRSVSVEFYNYALNTDSAPGDGLNKDTPPALPASGVRYEFNSHGDSVAYDQYTSFAGGGPTADEWVYGGPLGSLAAPDDVTPPAEYAMQSGYEVRTNDGRGSALLAVLKWDGAGGLEYL